MPEFLTEKEAAELLRMKDAKSLARLRRMGEGPPSYHPTKSALYLAEEVLAWARTRRPGRGSPPPGPPAEVAEGGA